MAACRVGRPWGPEQRSLLLLAADPLPSGARQRLTGCGAPLAAGASAAALA